MTQSRSRALPRYQGRRDEKQIRTPHMKSQTHKQRRTATKEPLHKVSRVSASKQKYEKASRQAKTQISLRIRAGWSESSLVAFAFLRLLAIHRGINENPCQTGWMYRLIWVFADLPSLIVGFVVRWLIYFFFCTTYVQKSLYILELITFVAILALWSPAIRLSTLLSVFLLWC